MIRSRYRRIVFFFAQVIVRLIVWDVVLPRLGLRGWSRRTRAERLRRLAVRYRALAIQMGGVLIKVGQFLSARLDVLPEVITTELAGLQDEVPAEAFADIRRLAEAELGAPLAARFAAFDETPLAAASLGQVHRARLRPGPDGVEPPAVVVKIQRPTVELLIATDLAALKTVGNWLKRYPPIGRRADVPALLSEFSRILYEEIDYLAEGRNAETFAANFKADRGVRVPGVVWTHTTRRVLTLEDVYAIKITDYAAITAAGIDRGAVADRLFQTYLRQIFEQAFFHADPHPGNLFVERVEASTPLGTSGETPEPERPDRSWRLTFVDFGMIGRVPPNLRAGLREMVIGVGTRDAARLVKGSQLMGILLPQADLERLEQVEAQLFERFWGKTMSELQQINMSEMREFTREFRDVLYEMPFQVPEDLILLGRTLAILSGMCTGLSPQFNLWTGLTPFAEKLIADETAGAGLEFWLGEAGNWFRTVIALPRRLEAVLSRLERGQLQASVPQLSRQVSSLERAMHRLLGGVIFTALLFGGAQFFLAGQTVAGAVLLGAAAVALVWTLFFVRR
jgi:predicted unusual protein kinase regulating ubiquinone biosynthesis (AarF/ABC1/UbiB family)